MPTDPHQNDLENKLSEVPGKRRENLLTLTNDGINVNVVHSTKIIPPEKAPTPRRAHTFSSRKAFIAYAKLVSCPNSVFLIDPSNGNGELVLDETVPTGGVEKVSFAPAFSLQFMPWYKRLNTPLTIDQFRDLIAERKSEIIDFGIDCDGKRESIEKTPIRRILNQITVSTAVTVHDGTGNGAINGITAQTKVKAGTQDKHYDLPDSMTINVPVFADEDGGPLNIDINVVPSGNGASIKLLSGDLEEIKTAYYRKVLEDMRAIEAGFPCGYGKIGEQSHLFIKD